MSDNPNGARMTMLMGSQMTATPSPNQPSETHVGPGPDEGTGSKAEHLAETVKDLASEAVSGVGESHSVVETAASLEQAGSDLQQGALGRLADGLAGLIRRHPLPAILTGLAIGFVLGRKLRR